MRHPYESRKSWGLSARWRSAILLVGAASFFATGILCRYILARVLVRQDRMEHRALEPLEQTSLYALELGRMGARADTARMDSLERAYAGTYLDAEDSLQFLRLVQARRTGVGAGPDSGGRGKMDLLFRRVLDKNMVEARRMEEESRSSVDRAGWAILVLSMAGAATCLALHWISQAGARSDARFRSLVETSSMAIRISLDGRILYANRTCLKLFGYPDEDGFRQIPLRDTYAPASRATIDNVVREAAVKRVPPSVYDADCMRRDGSTFRARVSTSAIELDEGLAVVGFIQDISEQVQAQDALVRSETRFRTLVEDSSIAIRISMGGLPVYVNEACRNLFGYGDRESLLAIPVRETYHPDERPMLDERIRLRAAGGNPSSEYSTICLRQDGTPFHAQIWTTFERRNGGEAVVGFLVDTTESVHAAEREKAQREQLIHADRMASLGVLLAGMAHEINNPNNLAMFNADLLGRILSDAQPILDEYAQVHPGFALSGIPYEEMKPEVHALVEGIRGGALRIRDIIAGLKDFSRRNPLSDHRPVDLAQVVQSSLLLVGSLVRKSTDRFEIDLAEGLPMVGGDAQQLEQVVVNLLTNACQALPGKDRFLAIRARIPEPGFVEVEVEDEGVGIPPENLSKILDPFFTTKREQGGTGLGLSVSWSIVQAHRGSLSFSPREGGGTRAAVRLPALRPEEAR